jgi:hypothetical protein
MFMKGISGWLAFELIKSRSSSRVSFSLLSVPEVEEV